MQDGKLTYKEMIETLKNFRGEVKEKIQKDDKKTKLIVGMYNATKVSDVKNLKEFYGKLGNIVSAVEAAKKESLFHEETIDRLKVIHKYFQDAQKNLDVLNKYENVALDHSTYFKEPKDIMMPLHSMVSVFDREPFDYNLKQIMKAGWDEPPILGNVVNKEKDGIFLKDSDMMQVRDAVVKAHYLGKVCKCYINKKRSSYRKAINESKEISKILENLDKNIGDGSSDDSDKISKCSNDINNLKKTLNKFSKHYFSRYFADKAKYKKFKKNLSSIKLFCKEISEKSKN